LAGACKNIGYFRNDNDFDIVYKVLLRV